jgi:hypothetical protein
MARPICPPLPPMPVPLMSRLLKGGLSEAADGARARDRAGERRPTSGRPSAHRENAPPSGPLGRMCTHSRMHSFKADRTERVSGPARAGPAHPGPAREALGQPLSAMEGRMGRPGAVPGGPPGSPIPPTRTHGGDSDALRRAPPGARAHTAVLDRLQRPRAPESSRGVLKRRASPRRRCWQLGGSAVPLRRESVGRPA